MARRMRGDCALACLVLLAAAVRGFVPGADGPVTHQEALEGGLTSLLCDGTPDTEDDQLMLLVWYQDNAPIYSYDARVESSWSSASYNSSQRLAADLSQQPTALTVSSLRGEDQGLYHCRVDFLLSPTRNVGVNLTVIVLPSQPFFLDELGNKVENKIGPYHEGDTLVLSCLVIGGRPPPQISWYSGETLVDASDGISDIPGVRENELYLPLSRENAASLSCRASNTKLTQPVAAKLTIELYLSAYNVSIQWVRGTADGNLQAGRPAIVRCVAVGCHPQPDLSWWLDHRHLTKRSNQTWESLTSVVVSDLELTPSVGDNGATLACVATNPVMAPSRGSKADIVTLNVTYSPIVEVTNVGDGSVHTVVELDSLHLECDVRANPPVEKFIWYFNDIEIFPGTMWGNATSSKLTIEEVSRHHAGNYSCAARNTVGETRAEDIQITVYYPPECTKHGIELKNEILYCNINALPSPDTYFWYLQPESADSQHLSTGSGFLPLSQVTRPLSGLLKASCAASNGVSSQEIRCKNTFSLEHLRPQQPEQCDLVYENDDIQIRCAAVENATYYEIQIWRLSTSNSSLILDQLSGVNISTSGVLSHSGHSGWLLKTRLGNLRSGDEAGARACNRYGCSRTLMLRPSTALLYANAMPPWWEYLLDKDVGISVGCVVLLAVFILSTYLVISLVRRARRKPPSAVQVLQLADTVTEYNHVGVSTEQFRTSCSCQSSDSGESFEWPPATVNRVRITRVLRDPPPPDVTLTLHRESTV